MCFCCVRFSSFSTMPRDWLGRTSPNWPILCLVGRKTLTESMKTLITVLICFSLLAQSLHPVSKNVPPLTCYNLGTHVSIAIIFGTSVTEKIGNQNVLYFLTSPNLCFCTTWGKRKLEKCIFSLKCCMLFTKSTQNIKISPGYSWTTLHCQKIDWMHQTGPRILLSVSHMLYVNQICHGVGRCVKDGSCSSSSLSKSQWTVLMGYLNISTM